MADGALAELGELVPQRVEPLAVAADRHPPVLQQYDARGSARRHHRVPPGLRRADQHGARVRHGALGPRPRLARAARRRPARAHQRRLLHVPAGRPGDHRLPGRDDGRDGALPGAQRPRAGRAFRAAHRRRHRAPPHVGDVPHREGGRLGRGRQRDGGGARRRRRLAAARREVVRQLPAVGPRAGHGAPRGRAARAGRPRPVPHAPRPRRRQPQRDPHPPPQEQVRDARHGVRRGGSARRASRGRSVRSTAACAR